MRLDLSWSFWKFFEKCILKFMIHFFFNFNFFYSSIKDMLFVSEIVLWKQLKSLQLLTFLILICLAVRFIHSVSWCCINLIKWIHCLNSYQSLVIDHQFFQQKLASVQLFNCATVQLFSIQTLCMCNNFNLNFKYKDILSKVIYIKGKSSYWLCLVLLS